MTSLQRIARYVLLANGFFMLLYGVVVMVQPDLFTDNLEIYSGTSMSELSKSHSRLASYIDMIVRLNGAFNVLLGAVGMIVVIRSFRLKKKWLFWIIILANILGYLAPMTFDQITGVIRYPEIIEIVVFVFSLVALIIIWPEFRKKSL
ncbi:MAG: hypothetical protein OEQ81_09395 [Flavobacteriaceae bacterium]|nr:hypothetical protein [Flavobacteriaceae bacterium]